MSEEIKAVEQEEVVETTEVVEEQHEEVAAPVPSKYEETARAQGWVPKEEWNGDPDDWTDAKEFVRRGELFSKISSQSQEMKEMRKAMSALIEHHQKVKETEYTRALSYLKSQKKAALEEGDADKLLEVEDAIDVLKTEQQQNKQETKEEVKQQLSPDFVDWVRANQWYAKDPEMRAFADDVGVGYFSRHKGASEKEVYQYVAERVKKAYPEKFKGQGTKIPTVESGSSGNRVTKTNDVKLTDEQRAVMNTFVRQGIMTKEEYIADLKTMGVV